MSGFAAILGTADGLPIVDRMLESQAYRGQRREIREVAPGVVVGQQWREREASRRGGIAHLGGQVFVVGDTRLDDRDRLADDIERADGHVPKDATDQLLIAAAYRAFGERFLEYLLGDFAFVLYDASTDRMIGARDHLGIRPFAYGIGAGGAFVSGSTTSAVLAAPGISRDVDELAIALMLAWDMPGRGRTFFRGVDALPSAHRLELRGGRPRIDRYRAFDPSGHAEGSASELTERFRELFIRAVDRRLVDAGTVSCELSGGLDSTGVAGAVAALTGEPPRLLAIESEADAPYIGLAIDAFGGDALVLPPRAIVERSREVRPGDYDTPFILQGMVIVNTTTHAASTMGADTLLTGLDGDVVVSYGYGRLADLLLGGKVLALVDETRRAARVRELPSWSVLRKYALGPTLGDLRRRLMPGEAPWAGHLIDPGFARRVGLDAVMEPRSGSSGRGSVARQQHLSGVVAHWRDLHFDLIDEVAGRAGVEVRFPYWDVELVEFCLSLPSAVLLHDGWPRWIQRAALKDLIPSQVAWRPWKGDLGDLQVDIVLARREQIEALLSSGGGVVGGLVDLREMASAWEDVITSRDLRAAVELVVPLNLEQWLAERSS